MKKKIKESKEDKEVFVLYDPDPHCVAEDKDLEGWQYDFADRVWVPVYYNTKPKRKK